MICFVFLDIFFNTLALVKLHIKQDNESFSEFVNDCHGVTSQNCCMAARRAIFSRHTITNL